MGSHLLNSIPNFNVDESEEELEGDPLDDIPATVYTTESVHYDFLPTSWRVLIDPISNGLIALQPNFKKYKVVKGRHFYHFCDTMRESPRPDTPLNSTELNVTMASISAFVSAFDSSADTCHKGSRTTLSHL